MWWIRCSGPLSTTPRFISLSADGELRFLPNFAGYLRERLVAAPYLGLSILWVDDNPGNNVEIVPKLRYGGAAKVDLALTTKEALAHPDIRAYDLVLSDMSRHSDDRAGYTLLKRLREQDILAPVIFFAGYTMRHCPGAPGAGGRRGRLRCDQLCRGTAVAC